MLFCTILLLLLYSVTFQRRGETSERFRFVTITGRPPGAGWSWATEFRNVFRQVSAADVRFVEGIVMVRAGAKRGLVRFLVPSVAPSTAERIDPFSEIKCRARA